MSLLSQSAFLKALGWSLFSSIWQMGLLWLLYILITANGKKYQSGQRHTLALLSVAGGSAWFIITLVLNFYRAGNHPVSVIRINQDEFPRLFSMFFEVLPRLDMMMPVLSLAYLFIILFLSARLYGQYRQTKKLSHRRLSKVRPELRVFLKQLAEQIGIHKEVRIWLSELIDTPLTIGFWKPVILLPVAVINHLTIQQAEAIILHELYHIKRNDYLINLMIACVEIVLFFNPFARVLTGFVKKERENSCDDMVLQFRYDPRQYAKALLLLEKNRVQTHQVSLAATGNSHHLLLNRVKRMLNNEPVITPIDQRLLVCICSVLIIGFVGLYNPGNKVVQPIRKTENAIRTFPVSQERISFLSSPIPLKEKISSPPNNKKQSSSNTAAEMISTDQLVRKTVDDLVTAASNDNEEQQPKEMATYAIEPDVREYSIVDNPVIVPTQNSNEVYPYVPSASYSFQLVEDTAFPKKYILTYSEQQAKESMEKSLKAIQEINWEKLAKEINREGKKLDIEKLRKELLKAMENVDWKKVNADVQSSLSLAQDEVLQDNEELRLELEKHQKERVITKQKSKQTEENIIRSRLEEQQCIKENELKNKKDIKSKKKLVYI